MNAVWAGVIIYAILQVALIAGVIGVIAASFMRRRHGESSTTEPHWVRTDEVFRDPSTLRLMRVWIDEVGTRHYVSEP